MDAGANQVFLAGDSQPAVLGPRRQQYSAGVVFIPRLGGNHLMVAVGHYSGNCLGRQNLYAEPLGMGLHLLGKLATADTFCESRIIVDALGDPRLATDAALLDD